MVRHWLQVLWLLFITSSVMGQDRTQQFKNWDKDGDSQLEKLELPAGLRGNFERVDTNRDGFISLDEHLAVRNRSATQTLRLPEGVVAHRDLAYVEAGHDRQKLDLYLPNNTDGQSLALVVWIHGGGWQNGSRSPCPALFLTKHGYAVASIGYRLSDTAVFPAQIHDCKAAIRFLRSRSETYHLDPDRFGAWGSSAGGHLVALLGTSGNAPELEGQLGRSDISSSVQAVCDYFGPTDLQKMASQSGPNSRIDHDAVNSPESKLLGGPLQEQTSLARKANPITYVDAQDPPFLIMHGDKDPLVPLAQSELLNEALSMAGVQTRLHVVRGGGHGPFREAEQLDEVREFFDATLAKK